MSKMIKKLCFGVALAAIVGVSAGVSACGTSKHPNARITIEFNSKTYVLDYTLYRNMYPQTVQHFIELADANFYDDTIIHDYKTSDWFGGGYSYNKSEKVTDENGEVSYVPTDYLSSYSRSGGMQYYLNVNSKEKEYYDLVTEGLKNGSFSASVYKSMTFDSNLEYTVDIADALPTVIGEFSLNDHKIKDNKGLKATYGTLKMYYYNKDDKSTVYVKDSFGATMPRNYEYNCATSLFAMQINPSSSYDASKYAVFGQLKNEKAKVALEALTDAIDDYRTSVSSSNWTSTVQMFVDTEDTFGTDNIDVSFTSLSVPIIVKSIKITKH